MVLVALLALMPGAACVPDTNVRDERRGAADPSPSRADPDRSAGAPSVAPGAPSGPPELLRFSVSLAADCVRVEAETTAPVTAEVRFQAGGHSDVRPLGTGASVFDQAFRLALPAGAEADAVVAFGAATDPLAPAGAAPEHFRIPAAPALPVAITEVLPNPAGAETSQEYVELRNLGDAPVVLDGLAIEDDAGRDLLPVATLAPGAWALVVGASFIEGAPGDVAPRPGTPLLRVGGRIGRDGLRQQGEPVRLLAADGSVLSSYGGHVDTTRPAWSGRSIQRVPDPGACDHPQAWSMAPLDPTPGW